MNNLGNNIWHILMSHLTYLDPTAFTYDKYKYKMTPETMKYKVTLIYIRIR